MTFKLNPLPYAPDALEPYVSEKTLLFHHGKHHRGYVDKLNGIVEGTDLDGAALEEVILIAREKSDHNLFNNAAQSWNHDFFWRSMSPDRGRPSQEVEAALDRAFGGVEAFRDAFKRAATGQFGSGWAWLVANGDRLEIMSTGNADTPITEGRVPLVCCDVWEHAYYLDYQNERGKFVDAFLKHLINWGFVQQNLDSAGSMAERGIRRQAAAVAK